MKQLKEGKQVGGQQSPTRKENDALDKLRRYARLWYVKGVQTTVDINLDEILEEDVME